jgi:hypothetical protein
VPFGPYPATPGRVTVAGHPSNELEEMDEDPRKGIVKQGRYKAMKEYVAIFEKSSTGWSAYVPDPPGPGGAAPATKPPSNSTAKGSPFPSKASAPADPTPNPPPA